MRKKTLTLTLCVLLVIACSGAAGAAEFLTKVTPHFVIRYKPVGVTANMEELSAELEAYYQRLLNFVGGKPGRRITIKWYPTIEEYQKGETSDHGGDVDSYRKEIMTGGEPSMVIYGVTFITANSVGKPSRFICEGLAVAYFQEHEGSSWFWEEPLINSVKNRMGDWIELERLSRDLYYFRDKPIARAEAGIFLRYLADTYGVEKFRKFMKNLQPESSLNLKTKSVYQKTLSELEAELKEWIRSQPKSVADPPYGALLETGGVEYRKQRYVFDEYVVTPILEADAARADKLLATLKADLGLAPSARIRWLVTHSGTLKYVRGIKEAGYVDEAGVVRAVPYYEPQLLTLAAARMSGKAPEVLRWGVSLVWGTPEEGQLRFKTRTIADWGRYLAEEKKIVPLETLLTAFSATPADTECAEAGALVRYLVDTHGKEKFGEFFRAVNAGQSLVPALESLTGKTLPELEKEFVASLGASR